MGNRISDGKELRASIEFLRKTYADLKKQELDDRLMSFYEKLGGDNDKQEKAINELLLVKKAFDITDSIVNRHAVFVTEIDKEDPNDKKE